MKIGRYLGDRNILTVVSLISFTLIGLTSMTVINGNSLNIGKHTGNSLNEQAYASTPVTVNVLIYDGEGVIPGSVDGIKDCLDYVNGENIDLNVYSNYSTIEEINSQTLPGYDILIMPGGLGITYINNPEINAEDLKNFVKNGKGYVGICAGAYAASKHVDGDYDGWGIAQDINSKPVDYVGNLPISMTSSGGIILNSQNLKNFGGQKTSSFLNFGDSVTMYHWNGPAMYKTDGSNDSLAVYVANETGYQNYAAIATDTHGSGRIVLSGPHPELSPTKPEMLARMILWAAKKI
ncbi:MULTISPECIES: BPL-N domain-containing protein [Methanobacterium]|uniref:BPL-N domain-containing protein n=1 Tax=Methanobacterium veterum TaxID=408577 RepID=A0A9E5A2L1_9EURY|nr:MULTISPECIES: BPL-N domain-containing protein [Methanobacterium]MCZ3365738.1 BPL-N domain-containing protein [Methanobacterium veterum]MCZ3371202.1 BPL-N domain-containing protein [Methanobacterium veterum]